MNLVQHLAWNIKGDVSHKMATINYKTIGFFILMLLAILLTLKGALAETIPFNQCIQVIDFTNGSAFPGLTCNFYNFTNNIPMSYQSNQYCVQINSTYSVGTYPFVATCTDGIWNKSTYGQFKVEEVDNTQKSVGITTTIIQNNVTQILCPEGLTLVNDTCLDKREIAETYSATSIVVTSALIMLIIAGAFALIWYYFWNKKEKD